MADFDGLTGRKLRKAKFKVKLEKYIEQYPAILIATINHVGSNQMQKVRISIRGKGAILCGKNTMIRRVMTDLVESQKYPQLDSLLQSDLIKFNVALIFTSVNELAEVRKIVESNQVPAAAKTGVVAPVDVILPAGPTGLDPGQTAFFQAANIATKITKGSIELVNPITLIKKDQKVPATAVALLTKMGIRPFHFGINITSVYENGFIYKADVLDLTKEDLLRKFVSGVSYVACLSLGARYPTLASVVHSVARGYQKLAAIAIETTYVFDEIKETKALLSDPEALAKAQAAAKAGAAAAPAAGGAVAAVAAVAAPEPEEEEEAPSMDLFGGGGDY
jgi:large subunit ribosomal protein LP0